MLFRSNMYGGARYPAPAVVGNFGSAIASSMGESAAKVAPAPRPVRRVAVVKVKPAAPVDLGKHIEVYRGTKSDQVKVGGSYGG